VGRSRDVWNVLGRRPTTSRIIADPRLANLIAEVHIRAHSVTILLLGDSSAESQLTEKLWAVETGELEESGVAGEVDEQS
jgi:hypothetical protein